MGARSLFGKLLAALAVAMLVTAPVSGQIARKSTGSYAQSNTFTFPGPWWDDGTATQGRTASQTLNLNTFNGLTWIGNAGAVTSRDNIQTSASSTATFGAFKGSAGSNGNQTYTYINAPTATAIQVTRGVALGLTSGATFTNSADFLLPATCCASGSNSWSFVEAELGSIGAGSITPKFQLNGVGSGSGSNIGTGAPGAGQISVAAGDNYRTSYYPCNGNTCQDIDFDGQKVKIGGIVSGLGFNLTAFNFGQQGALTGTPNKINYFGLCDPNTQGCVSLTLGSKIVPIDSNGDFTPHFTGTYTKGSLAGLTYSLYDGTTGLVTAVANVTATLDSTGGLIGALQPTTFTGSISGTTLTIATEVGSGARVSDVLTGTGITAGSYIVNQLTGVQGSTGTYTVSASSAATGSITITATPQEPTYEKVYRAHGTKILKANIPASFYEEVCRTDIIAGQPKSCARGPIVTVGLVEGCMGQSICEQSYPTNLDYNATFGSTNYSYVMGSWGAAGWVVSQWDVRALPLNSVTTFTTPKASVAFLYSSQRAAQSTAPGVNFLEGGIGGTTAYQRAQPGSLAILGLENAIDLAGGDVTGMWDSSGTFDAVGSGNGSNADYAAMMDQFYTTIETYIGHTLPVTILSLGMTEAESTSTVTQGQYDTNRRIQFNQSIAGSRYCALGLNLALMTHGPSDKYHSLNGYGWGYEYWLAGMSVNNCQAGGTTYKRGIYLNSATETDDHTLDVLVDVWNAAALLPTNTGNATYGFDQGFNFGVWNGSTLSTALGALHATSFSCGAIASNQAHCTVGFAGTPFAGALHGAVTGPRGSNPFHPADSLGDTINNSGTVNKDYWMDGANALMAVAPATGTIDGTITTNVLTGTVTSGVLKVGDWLKDPTTTRSFLITSFGTGTGVNGNTGTYNLLLAANQASTTTFTAAEPMVSVQPYFKVGGSSTGSDDFVTTP